MGPDDAARRLAALAPPTVTFGERQCRETVHPAVMEALAAANRGHAVAYGDDPWTRELQTSVEDLFGTSLDVLPVWGGTGANVVALACMVRASDAVVCPASAHIHVDEAGAPERVAGCKVLPVPTPDGKLRPDDLRSHLGWLGDEHHPQPKVVSISQCTEQGTLYTPDEIGTLCEEAHRHGMLVHVDGARIANAAVALGDDVRAFTIDAGVDVLSFGGTKNGCMYGELVVFFRPETAQRARHVRKQLAQLPSKSRFIAAQFLALFTDDLWLQLARHANDMATLLAKEVRECAAVGIAREPAVNSVFAMLPAHAVKALQDWCSFYVWDEKLHEVRWMTAWDTSPDDVAAFRGVRAAVGDEA